MKDNTQQQERGLLEGSAWPNDRRERKHTNPQEGVWAELAATLLAPRATPVSVGFDGPGGVMERSEAPCAAL
jgi:hypothetical protein